MANPVTVNEKGFTVLYESPHPVVDLVFVHGFTGHPRDTWTLKRAQPKNGAKRHGPDDSVSEAAKRSKIPRLQFFGRSPSASSSVASPTPGSSRTPTEKSTKSQDKTVPAAQEWQDVYWPADLTCKTVPDSRILTYGYDTTVRHWVSGPVSKKSLYDHAWDFLCDLEERRRHPNEKRRPIVFVAHSLGGIVVKEALRRSRGCHSLKPHLYTIFEATSSVLFFGTPHGGADPRNPFHHILSAFVQAFGVQVNKQIVGTLMPEAERLTELRDEFPAMCQERNWIIYSYQEEYPLRALLGTKVVEDQSSCLNNPALETRRFISSNHMDMCRFSGIDDPEYIKVAAALEHILSLLREREDCGKETNSPLTEETPGVPHPPEDAELDAAPRERHDNRNARLIGDRCISEELRRSLIDQLHFDKIDDRLTNLTAAQGRTCRWFLAEPKYTSWRDPSGQPGHGGFLWIKGNPGTGKSTLMKFLFEEAKSKAKGDPSQILLSFFFLARGVLEEKSTLGLYRSLLHQLFEKAADLQDSLEWMTADGARGIQADGWREEALKQTLRHAVQKLGSRTLTIFVDALDECEDNQARDMVSFFEEVCDLAQEVQARLRICLSSRHYPHIENDPDIELVLEDETGHEKDIEQYIAAKLRLRKTKAAQSLQAEIVKRSSLIFLWVVLVVDILNSEYPGKPLDKMRQRLEEIPPKLADLFEMILTRDEENPKLMQMCLQWILFAFRPLKPQELYFAVQFGMREDVSFGQWDQETLDLDTMKAFVRHSSKGLAEVTRNKASEVQFIHESVRDFLVGKYGGQWPGADGDFEGQAHETMKHCCLTQLEAVDLCLALFGQKNRDTKEPLARPLPQPSLAREVPGIQTRNSRLDEEVNRMDDEPSATQLRETLRLEYPFVEYSMLNVLRHADTAQHHGLQQRAFLDGFPLSLWIKTHDTFERFVIRRYGEQTPLIYILAEKNLANLIKVSSQKKSCFNVWPNARYGSPIIAALAVGSDETIQALLEAEVRTQPPECRRQLGKLFKKCLEEHGMPARLGANFRFSKQAGVLGSLARHGSNALLAIMLNSHHLKSHLRSPSHRASLYYAVEGGQQTSVRLLLEKSHSIERDGANYETVLKFAAVGGHEAILEMLLKEGADVHHLDSDDDRTPLSHAAEHGHFATAHLLLGWGAETDGVCRDGRTPLSYAAGNGHEPVARLLLERDAFVDLQDQNSPPPLVYAVVHQHETLVALLLENGADPDGKGAPYGPYVPPLSYAAERGAEGVARLLVEMGATIDAKTPDGQTSLSVAAENGHETIAALLLRNGADVNSRSNGGLTPLSYAAAKGHEAVVRLLLAQGAAVDLHGSFLGWTALSYAVNEVREGVARLLLDAGADVDLKDSNGQTPLSLTTQYTPLVTVPLWLPNDKARPIPPLPISPHNGGIGVAMILLEKGADFDSRDNQGRTPLFFAAQFGLEHLARILLLNGANADLASNAGTTPLFLATHRGHEGVKRLLLEAGAQTDPKDALSMSPLSYAD